MRDLVQSEKKAWIELLEQMKVISEQISAGKDIEAEVPNLSKSIKRYRQMHDKKAAVPREPSRI